MSTTAAEPHRMAVMRAKARGRGKEPPQAETPSPARAAAQERHSLALGRFRAALWHDDLPLGDALREMGARVDATCDALAARLAFAHEKLAQAERER